MFKPFLHRGHLAILSRLLLDLIFLSILVLSVGKWIGRDPESETRFLGAYAIVLIATTVAVVTFLGAWARLRRRREPRARMLAGFLLYLVVPAAYGISAVLPVAETDRGVIELSAMTLAIFVILARVALPGMPAAIRQRVLVFGSGIRAQALQHALAESGVPVDIVGFYPGTAEKDALIPLQDLLPSSRSLVETARDLQADSIVVAVEERRGGAMPLGELLDCRLSGVRVLDPASYFEQTLGQIRLDALYAGWLVFGQGFRQGFGRTLVKRLFDVAFASMLVTITLPIMLLTALLIVLESGFPIFYRQERVGLHGRLFNVIKFRSMRTDAERDGQPRWASAKDDRVTRVGRVIRKLRIDELPQLLSVLAGDMSLVGPRPERPFFVDQLLREIPFYAVRHSIKPGLTGWAQVRYHYGASVEDAAAKLQYDLYYVKNHSLFLDLRILWDTVGVVLTARGAN